jgi:hypothetical protein
MAWKSRRQSSMLAPVQREWEPGVVDLKFLRFCGTLV